MSINLVEFDNHFFENLADKSAIIISDDGIYYTILFNNKKAGIVGYIPAKNENSGFVQIVINPKFRGQDLVARSEDLLAKKHKLGKLFATIDTSNIISIKAHQKAGFKIMSDDELNSLTAKGLLDSGNTRLVKTYK